MSYNILMTKKQSVKTPLDRTALSRNQQRALALFDSSPTITVGEVAGQLTLPRPTAKQVLARLVTLGFLERSGQLKGTFYSLKNEDNVLDEFGNEIVRVYKGLAGFTRLFQSMQANLKKGDFYWSFAFKNEYYDPAVGELLLNFHQELTRKGIDDRTIVHAEVLKVVRHTYRNVPDLKIRAISQEIPTGMVILKDQVVHLVWGERPMAIAITSPAIISRYQAFFAMTWQKCTAQKSGRKL